jgi:hypothetical protein
MSSVFPGFFCHFICTSHKINRFQSFEIQFSSVQSSVHFSAQSTSVSLGNSRRLTISSYNTSTAHGNESNIQLASSIACSFTHPLHYALLEARVHRAAWTLALPFCHRSRGNSQEDGPRNHSCLVHSSATKNRRLVRQSWYE